MNASNGHIHADWDCVADKLYAHSSCQHKLDCIMQLGAIGLFIKTPFFTMCMGKLTVYTLFLN